MSDCFDHALDAMESQERAYLWGEVGPSFNFKPNPLFYFRKIKFVQIEAETRKAVLLKFNEETTIWIPSSICRNWDVANKTVYIHKRILDKIMKENENEDDDGDI